MPPINLHPVLSPNLDEFRLFVNVKFLVISKNSVGISIEFIRELTLSGHFCWLARGFRSLFSGKTLFFYGVEGRACVVGGSLKLVFDYDVPRKEQSFRNQISEIWIIWNSCFFRESKILTITEFQNLGWDSRYYVSITVCKLFQFSNLVMLILHIFVWGFFSEKQFLCLMSYVLCLMCL